MYSRIRASKGLSGSAAWQMAQKNIVQVAFVRWRGDSKIVEAAAEHDFCSEAYRNVLCNRVRTISAVLSAGQGQRTEPLAP